MINFLDSPAAEAYGEKVNGCVLLYRRSSWRHRDRSVLGVTELATLAGFDKLSIPGFYMYGKEDVLRPHHLFGHAQEDALANIQFFYPEETGHQGQTDQPEMFNQVFLEFFRDGKVSAKSAEWGGGSTRRPANPDLVEIRDTTA